MMLLMVTPNRWRIDWSAKDKGETYTLAKDSSIAMPYDVTVLRAGYCHEKNPGNM